MVKRKAVTNGTARHAKKRRKSDHDANDDEEEDKENHTEEEEGDNEELSDVQMDDAEHSAERR